MFSLEMRSAVKVTVTGKQYVTLHDHKMYPHTKFGIASSNSIADMLRVQFGGQTEGLIEGWLVRQFNYYTCNCPLSKL